MFGSKKEIFRLKKMFRELEKRHNALLDFLKIEGEFILNPNPHSSQTFIFLKYIKKEKCSKCGHFFDNETNRKTKRGT
jgi:hypothetical protein